MAKRGVMYQTTEELRRAVKLLPRPAYRVALEVGFHPSSLSMMLHGGRRVRRDDPRLRVLAAVVGLPVSRCVEKVEPGPVR